MGLLDHKPCVCVSRWRSNSSGVIKEVFISALKAGPDFSVPGTVPYFVFVNILQFVFNKISASKL